jgi:hypothetical protein
MDPERQPAYRSPRCSLRQIRRSRYLRQRRVRREYFSARNRGSQAKKPRYRLLLEAARCYNEHCDFAADAHARSIPEEVAMDEASLEGALNELAKQFGEGVDFTHSKLADLAKQAEANRKQLQKSINTLQELLDYLRVCIKYQAFDLEATRRENTYLRKLLEDSNNNRDEGGSSNA